MHSTAKILGDTLHIVHDWDSLEPAREYADHLESKFAHALTGIHEIDISIPRYGVVCDGVVVYTAARDIPEPRHVPHVDLEPAPDEVHISGRLEHPPYGTAM